MSWKRETALPRPLGLTRRSSSSRVLVDERFAWLPPPILQQLPLLGSMARSAYDLRCSV
jgi:hypothetical protein